MKVKRIEKKHKTKINFSENIPPQNEELQARDKILIKRGINLYKMHETVVNHALHRFTFETSESTFLNCEV